MRRPLRWITWCWLVVSLCGLVVLLAGCGGNAEPVIVTLATEVTSTPVPPPTSTRVAAAPVATVSPAPTRKPSTATPGPSPTAPVAPTQSPVPVTRTPTRVPTLSGVAIEYFTTNSQSIRPGDSVTLFWSVRGADRVRIYRVDAQGERIWRWDVNAADSLTVSTRAEDRDVARFALVAELGETEVEQPLLIPVLCSEVWFFDPAPESCPAGSPQISAHAEQTFEHGRMIWSEAQDRIYVLFDDGGRPGWVQYPDTFVEGDPESDETLVPPPGLLQPIRGFGMIWRNNARIRERLGWATTPEVAFEGMMQADAVELSVATLYLRARDGIILALDALDDDWEVLPPGS